MTLAHTNDNYIVKYIKINDTYKINDFESEDLIYNPFNEKNKELTYDSLQNILNKYGVYYNIQNLEIFKRAFVHKSYVEPSKLNDDVVSIRPPNCVDLCSRSMND